MLKTLMQVNIDLICIVTIILNYICAMSEGIKSWLILLLLALIWGSSFILMKKAMFTTDGYNIYSDVQVGSLRMMFASLVLLPFAIRLFRKIKRVKSLIMLALVGFCGNFFPAFLFTYSETGISSGYAGMLNSCTPIFALIIGFVIFKQRLTSLQIAGVLIGTVGVISLMIAGHDLSISGGWSHILAVVLATFFYAISLNTIKYTLPELKSFEITVLSFSLILIPSTVIAFVSDSWQTTVGHPEAMTGLFYLLILSVVGTAFAVAIFTYLVNISSVIFASSVTYLIPIVAVLIGLAFNETISIWQIISMIVVLSGVFIANYKTLIKVKSKP